jgi:hypothetical protein
VSRIRELREELLEDVKDAVRWYEGEEPGLGEKFLTSFYDAVARAERHPDMFLPVEQGCRRVLLDRFPYTLHFRVEDSRLVFFLLFHGARDPRARRREVRRRRE